MAKRKIVTIGEETLRRKSREVTVFDEKLHTLLEDMAETMYDANGCGLAAPQVGILRRVVVVDMQPGDEKARMELVNPVIIAAEGEEEEVEGCLSVPGRQGYVIRPQKVRVRAQDRHGTFFEIEGEGRMGRCFCHEIDHLEGRLYVDIMTEEYFPQEQEEEETGELQA